MNILDVIILLPFVWAIYRGYKEGVIVQLGGLAGLLAGIWLASRYARGLGEWMGLDPSYGTIAGFVIIVLLTLIFIVLAGKLLKEVCKFAGLGMFDTAGGVIISVAKMALILSVVFVAFDTLNLRRSLVRRDVFEKSALYYPIKSIAPSLFPVLNSARHKLSHAPIIEYRVIKDTKNI